MQEDEEEKKEDDEGTRRDEEDMQDSLVVKEGMMLKFPLVPFSAYLFPLHLLLQFFPPRRS